MADFAKLRETVVIPDPAMSNTFRSNDKKVWSASPILRMAAWQRHRTSHGAGPTPTTVLCWPSRRLKPRRFSGAHCNRSITADLPRTLLAASIATGSLAIGYGEITSATARASAKKLYHSASRVSAAIATAWRGAVAYARVATLALWAWSRRATSLGLSRSSVGLGRGRMPRPWCVNRWAVLTGY